jgi:hypothetical protein
LLRDLKFSGFDLDLIGFEPDRLEEILTGLRPSGLSDPDSVPEVPDQPLTGPGDVCCWEITAWAAVTAPVRRMSSRDWRDRSPT